MKAIVLKLTLLLGTLTMAISGIPRPAAAANPQMPTKFMFSLEARPGNGAASKCGFTDIVELGTNYCGVSQYYGKKTRAVIWSDWEIGSWDVLNGYLPGESGYAGYTNVSIKTPTSCNEMCVSQAGSFFYTNLNYPSESFKGTSSCSGWKIVNLDGTPRPNGFCDTTLYIDGTSGFKTKDRFGGCQFLNSWDFAGRFENDYYFKFWDYLNINITPTIKATVAHHSLGELYMGPRLGTWGTTTYTETIELSDPFTTASLVEMANANALMTVTNWQTCVTSPVAEFSVTADQVNATAKAAALRFKVFCPSNEVFEINYEIVREFYSNCVPWTNITYHTIRTQGTGGWQYIQLPDLTAVPGECLTDGCITYTPERKWLKVGCSSFGLGDCSSGSCSAGPGNTSVNINGESPIIQMDAGRGSAGGSPTLVAASLPPPPFSTGSMPEVQVLGDSAQSIIIFENNEVQQVLTSAGLIDISRSAPGTCVITFYPQYYGYLDGGKYSLSGYTPAATTTIQQQTGNPNQFTVSITRDSTTTHVLTWSPETHGWSLISGDGARKEVHSRDSSGLLHTKSIYGASGPAIYQEVERFAEIANLGNVMIEKSVGTGGQIQKTSWAYYNNAQTDGANYGRIKMVIEPTGAWRRYEYAPDGRVQREISQFLNAPTNAPDSQCRVVEYDYTPSASGVDMERRIEKLLGTEISRQYTLRTSAEERLIQCQTPGTTNLAAVDNLVTITTLDTSPEFLGKVRSVRHPDGTMQFYDYGYWGNELVTYSFSGSPNQAGTSVIDGTETHTYRGLFGITSSLSTDIATRVIVSQEGHGYDDLGRRTWTWAAPGASSSATYACCGMESLTDEDGTTTYFHYDALKRQAGQTVAGITTTNLLDANGNVLATWRIGSNNVQILLRKASYDTAGQLLYETNALNGVTSYQYSYPAQGVGYYVRTITYPDLGTRIETYYQDGSLASITGTAVQPVSYEYGVANDGLGRLSPFTREIKLSESYADTAERTTSFSDMLGRNYRTVYGAASGMPAATSWFNDKGQLSKSVDPDGVTTLYLYNALGELEYTALDINTNGIIDFAGTDRIAQTITEVTSDYGYNVRQTRTYVWPYENLNLPELVRVESHDFYGTWSWIQTPASLTDIQIYHDGWGARRQIRTDSMSGSEHRYYQDGRLSKVQTDSGPLAQTVEYGFDALGRAAYVTESKEGGDVAVTTNIFNSADLLVASISAIPAQGQPPLATTNYYSNMGRLWKVELPDRTAVTNEYYPTGLLKKKFGSREYPVEYSYDSQGRMKTMTTWSSFSTGAGAAVTTWNYDPYRGFLESKRYADQSGPAYSYTAAGRLRQRLWARNIQTIYGYNNAGELQTVDYSDTTPDITYGRDRLGRPSSATQGGVAVSAAYDLLGNLLSERHTAGPLAGLTLTNQFSGLFQRTNVSILNAQGALLHRTGYDYSGPVIQSVTQPTIGTTTPALNVSYSFLANSGLPSQINYSNSSSQWIMKRELNYDRLKRLTNVVHSAYKNSVWEPTASFGYQLNAAGQRTNITVQGSNYTRPAAWEFGYDALGQITSGHKRFDDGTLAAGLQFDYTFDEIGNRKSSAAAGGVNGLQKRSSAYSINPLNQYTSRSVPNYTSVSGTANADATVTLIDSAGDYARALRQGEHFFGELPVNNSTGAVWLTITNFAMLDSGGQQITTNINGSVLVPPAQQVFQHDADGNLTNDAVWVRTWNAENRVTRIESAASVPLAAKKREDWKYLPDGRWIERIVSTNNGSAYVAAYTNRFVWDGQVLLAILDNRNVPTATFMRGPDLSGTVHGAGGVGGVLAVNFAPSTLNAQPSTHFVSYDGNGNVVGLTDIATAETTAVYEYGPFGETVRATGPMASTMPLRFSTMFADDVTGDVKYLYRDLRVQEGQWTSRDPIGERGGKNLYGFVKGNPISKIDRLGLSYSLYCGIRSPSSFNPPGPTSPSRSDHANPNGPMGTARPGGELDQRAWFDSHYSGWSSEMQRRINERIQREMETSCRDGKRPSQIPLSDLNVEIIPTMSGEPPPFPFRASTSNPRTAEAGNNEEDYGDSPQSAVWVDQVLGRFWFEVGNAQVTWAKGPSGESCYSWSVSMTVTDGMGLNDPEDGLRQVIGESATAATFPGRREVRARWTLTGCGCCPCP